MNRLTIGLAFGMAASTASAVAQVTGSGTKGTMPVFTGPSSVGNSTIAVLGGNVGVGTTEVGGAR